MAFPHERRTPERSRAGRRAWRFRTNTGFPGSAKDKSRGSALRSTFRAGPVTNQKETVHSYPIFMPLCRKGPGASLSRFVVEFRQRGSCRTYDPHVKPGLENGSSQSRWPEWAEIHGFPSGEGFLSGKFPVVGFGQWSVSVVGFSGCRLQAGDATGGIFLCWEGPFVNYPFFLIPVDIPFDCSIP